MINIRVDEKIDMPDSGLLGRAVTQVLQSEEVDPDVDVVVQITDDAQLQALNKQFLGIDEPTDVLAFPGGEVDPDTQALYLGDVIISHQRALAQANAGGHSVEAELQLLIVHGVLHLLGYDHGEEAEKTLMWAVQNDILSQLGVAIDLSNLPADKDSPGR